jgi:hypothetical protein
MCPEGPIASWRPTCIFNYQSPMECFKLSTVKGEHDTLAGADHNQMLVTLAHLSEKFSRA